MIRRLAISLPLLLALASPAWGQAPAPTPSPAPVPPLAAGPKVVIAPVERGWATYPVILDVSQSVGNKIDVTAPGSDFYESIPWPADEKKKRSYRIILRYPTPGEYTIKVRSLGVVNGEADEVFGTATIQQIEKPAPPPPVPPPTPDPGPTPTPTPVPPTPTPVVTGKLFVTLVVDANAMTAGLAKVRAGLAIRPALRGMNAEYLTYTTDASAGNPIDSLKLRPYLAKSGVPALIVQNEKGEVIPEPSPAPVDEDGVIAKVKALRGVKP